MQIRFILIFIAFSLLVSCYQPQRDCKAFKDGKFTFTSIINNKEVSTVFERNGDLEIDYFDGKIDSSSVRWINDCEYIMKKMHPKNKAEEKSVHVKILTTTGNSYTFEYNIVGDNNKSRGTAIKTN
ncbi:DNA topoisomerase IV [Maribacter sp. TH_r10]|uniref:DNA topoisomerase IV n=1 Tax=Maribacter TaxID=252356 RepID=UPI002490F674|nr:MULTISPECIES: DNA topoisomerase IV [Maribacter]MDV7138909.1 DNA topoisomerase IV [Maribacter sp. TH_r10]